MSAPLPPELTPSAIAALAELAVMGTDERVIGWPGANGAETNAAAVVVRLLAKHYPAVVAVRVAFTGYVALTGRRGEPGAGS